MWTPRALAPFAIAALALGCGAGMERTARSELQERGFEDVALQPLERDHAAYSFTANRSGVACTGEIELQEQMGQTLATVSDHCGEE
jgi:hypothetical protein